MQTNTETKSRRPTTAFLVALNALIFLALLLCGLMNAPDPMGRALAIPVTAIFLAVSGVWQAIWAYFDRRFRIHNVLRCVGFVLPVTLLVLWLLPSFFRFELSRPINRQKATGNYQAWLVAESGGWTVEIQDRDGRTLHKEETDIVPHLNVYWIWGPNEQLWIYNTDDARVHCWYPESDGNWKHVLWGYGHTKETEAAVGAPPPDLYPDYAR